MKPPNLCDVCREPRKPMFGTVTIEMRAGLGERWITKRTVELCKEHYDKIYDGFWEEWK